MKELQYPAGPLPAHRKKTRWDTCKLASDFQEIESLRIFRFINLLPLKPSESSSVYDGFALFARLVALLGTSTKTNDKLEALACYFQSAPGADKVWVMALFTGRRPRRIASGALMLQWCAEIVNLPGWLMEESYHTVGDLGETIALLLPEVEEQGQNHAPLAYYLEEIMRLQAASEPSKKEFITRHWMQMNRDERFVFNKLLSGNFRIGVSQKTIVNALARSVQLEPSIIAHRISGHWDPGTTVYEDLLSAAGTASDGSKPYPFYLAYALEQPPEALGDPEAWQAEWKWDGIRGQIIKRRGELYVWSRGEELITDKFPEYQVLKERLPDGVVLDGEIIPFRTYMPGQEAIPVLPGLAQGHPLPFALMQTRIGRKNISKKQLLEAPICFFSYDLLEMEGKDLRNEPLVVRRQALEALVSHIQHPVLLLSESIPFSDWKALETIREKSRDFYAEGLMLKRKNSIYKAGRRTGDWWKWKVAPLTIDAVMIYAQKGTGRRSNLYTDYTFAVRDGDRLVPFTKAYSGLTDKEFGQVDAFVKKNSLEKFGPVRTVKPLLVFEIAFEGIQASNRHKSGVALRFPRMLRWRQDKPATDINTLDDLKKLLEIYGS